MAAENLQQCSGSDLLPHLKLSICDSLKNVEGLDHSRIGLCSLKFNKKLSSGDLIIPAFIRTCFGDLSCSEEDVIYQRLTEEVIHRILKIQFIKHCQLTSGGHLLLTLNKVLVTSAVVYDIVIKGDQFGKSTEENSQSVCLNPALFWRSYGRDQENLNLDQLRTLLVCEHAQELLQANGVSVTAVSYDFQTIRTEVGKIPVRQEMCQLFTPSNTSSYTDAWTEKDLMSKAKELGGILNRCRYGKQIEQAELAASKPSYDNQTTNSVQGVYCVCEGECFCGNFVVDVEEYLNESNQISQGLCNKPKVAMSCSLLKDVAKLELAGKSEVSTDMLLHVTSCRRTFMQQQVSTLWQMASKNLLANKQFYLTHGLVTVNNDGEKIQDHVDAMNLLRVREKQLRESYVLKYGDKVEGQGWESSIRQMAVAAVKLEILSVSPNSELKINLCESSREFRQATFVLYNCARLAKLFQNYEENVQKGVYPELPPVKDVDFNLLRDQAEWELVLNFILAFPSVIKETAPTTATKSQYVTIHTNKAIVKWHILESTVVYEIPMICTFLFTLSHKFSSYYGRVHILGESRHHLFPAMFARLYLMKAVQQIFLNCLKLLNVSSLTQM